MKRLKTPTPRQLYRNRALARVGNQWLHAEILKYPNNRKNPRLRLSGWKVRRLDTWQITWIWRAEDLAIVPPSEWLEPDDDY